MSALRGAIRLNTLKVPGYTLFDAAVHYDIKNIVNLKGQPAPGAERHQPGE